MFQRVMHGPITNDKVKSFPDMSKREIGYLIPIIIMMFWMGVYPQTFLRKMDTSINHLIKIVEKKKTLFIEAKKETIVLPDTVLAKDKSKEQHKDKEDKI
jgi:NADH-quinone oxidoreductase subunit M